jgi:hypothetical protein
MSPRFLSPGLSLFLCLFLAPLLAPAQTVHISVDASQSRVPVSPFIYGKNGCLSDSPSQPVSAAQWQFYRDAGVRICRENGGNNASKYNWQLKLTSHPDWYNNIYAHDWDHAVTSLQANLPDVQGIWAFQLIGKAAANTSNNFGDWAYNRSQWWSGVAQNLAGGGVPNPAGGSRALTEGDPTRYLVDWPASSTVGILDHWIRPTGLGLNRAGFRYWSMDNEPEIWNGTHDDVMPVQPSAEEFMQRYFAVAKLAKAKFPEIRLMGPVPANEWQWYNWATPIVGTDGKRYCWLEYFIKRVSEEQRSSGIRLLDVLDIHYYPGSSDPATIVQLHRTYFDRTYVHPEANGVHNVSGNWDNSVNKEYILGRCQDWLTKYMGDNHGVGLSVSETGIALDSAPVTAVWYASTLGEFMRNGVEVFTPWSWQKGMWEVLHLYSRYNYTTCVQSVSDDEATVSAYTTLDEATGNLSVVLVNRALNSARTAQVTLAGAGIADGTYNTLRLSGLPATETFVSHTTNALQQGTVQVSGKAFSLSLPALSVTTVLLKPVPDVIVTPPASSATRLVNLSVRSFASPGTGVLTMGLVISGTGSKSILLRGTGPALIPFGVSNALANPVLTLFGENQVVLQSNDDWGNATGAPVLTETSRQLGAFALSDNSLDSALLRSLPAGLFTAEVLDKTGGSGVALGEAYEVDSTSSLRLLNVSGRAWVGTAPNQLIAGFVIAGPGTKKVLIRAVGPGLAAFLPGYLKDPVLTVYRQGSQVPFYTDDNWSEVSYATEMGTVSKAVKAFDIDAASRDSVLLLTLPPGGYTAEVSGVSSTTGVALVEVYEVE